MINYDDDIETKDILNYWSQGVVLLDNDGSWSGYRVRDVMRRDHGPDQVVMKLASSKLTHGDPPPTVVLTRPEFFRKAILHRPRLGVMKSEAGEVILLTWKPGQGDMNKAIHQADILQRVLYSPKKMPEVLTEEAEFKAFGKAWAIVMKRIQSHANMTAPYDMYSLNVSNKFHHLSHKHNILLARGPQRGGARLKGGDKACVEHAVQYLNFKPVSLVNAIAACKKTGVSVLKNTMWLKKDDDDKVLILNGDRVLGCVGSTGKPAPLRDSNKKLSNINRCLLTRLLEEK